ncbi:hypothetical protein FB45DRAFT_379946 [Roridomyces roridus]|uniref:WDR59/RTC1-like RING zinc finger domain-containing protein n=1 Tax=Roridomyces roridus TaxID=1738132 RepID=A0AAD7B2J1_9AGAR|nr:hypothetical protein FB45DRAFT_379946 [Roridomyces roridus]
MGPDLTVRRPSWTPALDGSGNLNKGKQLLFYPPAEEEDFEPEYGSGDGFGSAEESPVERDIAGSAGSGGGESSEESSTLLKVLEIDMKQFVGDAVGNMSISPTSRDVVLAARRGLFIIDLESPTSVPRFLPQGGTWDVADVQWNPHRSRAEYIVSTSAEKLLIWNLHLSSPHTASTASSTQTQNPSAIQHVLHAHYRAITDINWHPAPEERDLVVTTGIDAWLWCWDLRAARGGRAVFGLSAFNAGGTQVKWNRQNPHILASSHAGEVLIWDRRHGSLPTTRVRAHRSKIYGIDWSPTDEGGLVTCALDGVIKVWDVNALMDDGERGGLYGATPSGTDAWACTSCAPRTTSGTGASWPHHHSGHDHTHTPIRTIRTANPVWRARHLPFGRGLLSLPQRGGTGLGMYQLGGENVYGDGDEPVQVFEGHTDVVKEFVWRRDADAKTFQLITWSKDRTLRFWPIDPESMQKVGFVRPPEPLPGAPPTTPPAPATFSFRNPPPPADVAEAQGITSSPALPVLSAPIGARTILAGVRAGGGPRANQHGNGHLLFEKARTPAVTTRMSRGTASGRRAVGAVDALTWLSNVKEVADAAGSVIGRSSSGGQRGSSAGGSERGNSRVRRRSDSQGPGRGPMEEGQTLQDELTSVVSKLVLANLKIKLEKHDLKKRTCTLGLHGPWGESSSVFIRITFTFPKDYPHGQHPNGTPTVELERNPLITLKKRAFILRHLRALRERRPCLEACLRFLSEGVKSGAPHHSDSSSDEEGERGRKSQTVSLLRNHKNLAEPRTSQGTFGPNGELVCFFRAPPRFVRNVLRDLPNTASPAKTSSELMHESVDMGSEQTRALRSPALVADAVRQLSLAATDRIVKPPEPRRPHEGEHILRIMTNLLTFSHDTSHHESSRVRDEDGFPTGDNSFSYSSARRSNVFITSTTDISGPDRQVANGYVFQAETIAGLCQKNAEVARDHGRYDHERIFKILFALFPPKEYPCEPSIIAVKMVTRLHDELYKMKDIQMLAMLSMIVLQGYPNASPQSKKKTPELRGTPTAKFTAPDYFSLSRASGPNLSPVSPHWPRIAPSPPTQAGLSTSNSSRGSWSSLFNAGSMRQFMSGVQDSLKDGLMTPSLDSSSSISAIPVPKSDRSNILRGPDSPLPRRKGIWRDGLPSPALVSKSWNDTSPGMKHAVSFSSAGHRRPGSSRYMTPKGNRKDRIVFYDAPTEFGPKGFAPALILEFLSHVHIYADVLFSWQLFHKRLELVKSVNHAGETDDRKEFDIGLMRTCPHCNTEQEGNFCTHCSRGMPICTVCRLPVKGLSRSCIRCLHVTHVSCWRRLDVPICPSGCGCLCDNLNRAPGGSTPGLASPLGSLTRQLAVPLKASFSKRS